MASFAMQISASRPTLAPFRAARPQRAARGRVVVRAEGITDKVKDAANQAKGAAKDAAGAVKGKAEDAKDAVSDTFSESGTDKAERKTKGAVDDAADAVKGGADDAKGAAKDAKNEVKRNL